MRHAIACFGWLFVGMAACSDEQVVVPAQEPVAPSPAATIYIEAGAARPADAPSEGVVAAVPAAHRSSEGVHIYPDKDIGRPTEVVGVLDFHTDADSQDKGFEQLKAKAASMGADAVIGAEFEHGDPGEKSHLSGMAVRYLDR